MEALNIAVLVAIILILLWVFPAFTSSLKKAAPAAVLIGGALVAGALLVDLPARFVTGGGDNVIINSDVNKDNDDDYGNVVVNNRDVTSDIEDIKELEDVVVNDNTNTENIAGELEKLMGGDIED